MEDELIQLGWTLAFLLGLYGFYCHWEAGRAELATAFRHRAGSGAGPRASESRRYRARCRWALLGCAVLAVSAIVVAF